MLSIDIYLLSTGYLLISIRYLSDTYSMSVWFGEEKDRCLQRSTVLVGEFFGCPSLLKPNLLQLAMSAQSIPETQPDDTKRCAGSCHHAHKAVCPLMSPHKVTTQSGVPAHVTTQSGVPAHVQGKTAVCPLMSSKQIQDFFGPRFYTRTHFMIFALLWNVLVKDKNQVFLKNTCFWGKLWF